MFLRPNTSEMLALEIAHTFPDKILQGKLGGCVQSKHALKLNIEHTANTVSRLGLCSQHGCSCKRHLHLT